MSELRKCDLCGKVYEPPVTTKVMLIRPTGGWSTTTFGPFELCPVCKNAFKAWVAERRAASDE